MSKHEFTVAIELDEAALRTLNASRDEIAYARGGRKGVDNLIVADPSEWAVTDLIDAIDSRVAKADIVDYREVLPPGERTRRDVEARKAARA